jgi:hypothetical protein
LKTELAIHGPSKSDGFFYLSITEGLVCMFGLEG